MSLRAHSILLAAAFVFSNNFAVLAAKADTVIGFDNSLEFLDSIELPPLPPQNNSGVCSGHISAAISEIVNRPELNRGKWAILVESLGGTNVYSLNPDSYMVPASNMKLLVTAAALQKLNLESKIRSTSVGDWIKTTNLKSNNAYANVLLSHLGGSQSVERTLTDLGIDAKGYRLRDGSGLSRNNLATPRTLVTTLKVMYHGRGSDTFLASLPVAGISGTLKHRLQQTTAQGIVRAKTGVSQRCESPIRLLRTSRTRHFGIQYYYQSTHQPIPRFRS